jgi:hypothetical protein
MEDDVLSIPLIRRELTSDVLGRHIYLFGRGASSAVVLRQLADAGAHEGAVVLTEDAESLSAAVLLRPGLPLGAIPTFSAIPTLALQEAIAGEELCAMPVWPSHVTVEGETVGQSFVEAAPSGDRPAYVILGAHIDMYALDAAAGRPIDPNALVAALLNALDRWSTQYAARGAAAVRGAMRFLPRAAPAPSLSSQKAG